MVSIPFFMQEIIRLFPAIASIEPIQGLRDPSSTPQESQLESCRYILWIIFVCQLMDTSHKITMFMQNKQNIHYEAINIKLFLCRENSHCIWENVFYWSCEFMIIIILSKLTNFIESLSWKEEDWKEWMEDVKIWLFI